MKKLFLALFALAAIGAASAQTKFPLVINCNEMGADVYINNKLYTKTVPNLRIQLPPAAYNIKIAKDGFREFQATVNVAAKAAGTVLNATLESIQPQAPAQAPVGKSIIPSFGLRIACNVSGAQIFVDGNPVGTTPNDAKIPLGKHEVRVSAPGFVDFVQKIEATAFVALSVTLQGLNQSLSVSSNVNGADVLINGNPAGKTPFQAQVPGGSYSVVVKAPGFLDFAQNIVVGNGPAQVNAMLQPMSFQVNVNGNVQGALVFVNGQQSGQTPFATALPPGSYTVLVRAPGFLDYQVQVAVNGPQAINAILQPATVSWQLKLPESLVNKDLKNGRDRGIDFWIDGQQQGEQNGPVFSAGQIQAGRHTLRFAAGGIVYETQVDIQLGKSYTFEPFLGINVK